MPEKDEIYIDIDIDISIHTHTCPILNAGLYSLVDSACCILEWFS